MSKQEWVHLGPGLGKMRNPDWTRKPAQVDAHAQDLGKLFAHLLKRDGQPCAYRHLWYTIGTIRKYLDDAEKKLLEDLFNLGVSTPEKFDWSDMKKPSTRTAKKRKR